MPIRHQYGHTPWSDDSFTWHLTTWGSCMFKEADGVTDPSKESA